MMIDLPVTGAGKHYINLDLFPLDRPEQPVAMSKLRRIALHSGHIPPNRRHRFVQILLFQPVMTTYAPF